MKRRQLIAALACLAVGMVGFASAYSTNLLENSQKEQTETPSTEKLSEASGVIPPKESSNQSVNVDEAAEVQKQVDMALKAKEEAQKLQEQKEEETQSEIQETSAEPQTLHFAPEDGLKWPLEGKVLMDYSMDHAVYFATLEQYQYNPAIVIDGAVNDKVYFIADGIISDISTNEETGCTVTQDLGDGYTAIYGQLKETNFEVGDSVMRSQVVGYVNEPTKYYAVEGSNLYFAMEKDGNPINPLEYFE